MIKPNILNRATSVLRPQYWGTKSARDLWIYARHHRAINATSRDIAAQVDTRRIAEIRDKYAHKTRKTLPWVRYINYEAEITREVFRAYKFDVFGKRGLRILDLGTGPGYWPLTCGHFGHDCVGVDIEEPIFGDLARAVDVERHVCRVTPSLDIPMLDGRYDLITGFQIAFDNTFVRTDQPAWSVDDWRAFVSAAFDRWLNPNGRIILTGVRSCLTRSPWYCPDTIGFFRSIGAQVTKGQIRLANSEQSRTALKAQAL